MKEPKYQVGEYVKTKSYMSEEYGKIVECRWKELPYEGGGTVFRHVYTVDFPDVLGTLFENELYKEE